MRCRPLESVSSRSLSAVSYTHLDVYKRQDENTAAIKKIFLEEENGEENGEKWIESHDKVQDDYGTITELNAAIDALAPRIPQLKKERCV